MYELIKWLHVGSAAISITGFAVRGALKLRGSAVLQKKWIKIVPHVVDTVLLVSALWLAVQISQYPFTAPWLTAKLIGLLVYIGLGLMVMRFTKTTQTRLAAYIGALATFGYIVLVARAHAPWPF